MAKINYRICTQMYPCIVYKINRNTAEQVSKPTIDSQSFETYEKGDRSGYGKSAQLYQSH